MIEDMSIRKLATPISLGVAARDLHLFWRGRTKSAPAGLEFTAKAFRATRWLAK